MYALYVPFGPGVVTAYEVWKLPGPTTSEVFMHTELPGAVAIRHDVDPQRCVFVPRLTETASPSVAPGRPGSESTPFSVAGWIVVPPPLLPAAVPETPTARVATMTPSTE